MIGPPRPRSKCKPRPKDYIKDNDIEYLERSYERTRNKLENKVIETSKKLHNRITDFAEFPNSEIQEGLLQSAYYALDDATIALISFEESI